MSNDDIIKKVKVEEGLTLYLNEDNGLGCAIDENTAGKYEIAVRDEQGNWNLYPVSYKPGINEATGQYEPLATISEEELAKLPQSKAFEPPLNIYETKESLVRDINKKGLENLGIRQTIDLGKGMIIPLFGMEEEEAYAITKVLPKTAFLIHEKNNEISILHPGAFSESVISVERKEQSANKDAVSLHELGVYKTIGNYTIDVGASAFNVEGYHPEKGFVKFSTPSLLHVFKKIGVNSDDKRFLTNRAMEFIDSAIEAQTKQAPIYQNNLTLTDALERTDDSTLAKMTRKPVWIVNKDYEIEPIPLLEYLENNAIEVATRKGIEREYKIVENKIIKNMTNSEPKVVYENDAPGPVVAEYMRMLAHSVSENDNAPYPHLTEQSAMEELKELLEIQREDEEEMKNNQALNIGM